MKGDKKMRATKTFDEVTEKKTVDTNGLQNMLSCGRKTAVEIGTAANAKISVGRRVLWNVARVQSYLNAISE